MYDMLREAQLCCRIMSNDRCTSNEKTCSPCMSQLVRHTVISNNILSKMPAKYRVRTTFDVAECHQEVDHGVMDGFWFFGVRMRSKERFCGTPFLLALSSRRARRCKVHL